MQNIRCATRSADNSISEAKKMMGLLLRTPISWPPYTRVDE